MASTTISEVRAGKTNSGEQSVSMSQSTKESGDGRTFKPGNGNNGSFTLTGRLHSFRNAFHGVALMLRSQHNAWLHAFASICVLTAGALFRLSDPEWCKIILAIMAVWTAEALNTALEFLADAAKPEFHPLVKCAKDVAAGGVLISAVGSVAIGLLVLGPHFLDFLRAHF
ncbi:MAG TPA: diacylglycerol kinase family protein [Sedimentisphaerales bacterium]|nr:diacylglycerol kinase family protein [Sedimentisphaerales bacterium]